MPTPTWEIPELHAGDSYPSSLLKYLLKHMMIQFGAQGACIALYDESINLLRLRVHVRLRTTHPSQPATGGLRPPKRRMAVHLEGDTASLPISASIKARRNLLPSEELEEIPPQQCQLFAPGTTYTPSKKDIIGYAWLKNEAYVMSHDEYLALFFDGQPLPIYCDCIPTSYLVVPIQEATPFDDVYEHRRQFNVLGVVVLYQITTGIGMAFQQSQRAEAVQYAERITLYLQNDRLQRSQRRASEYLQHLQQVSAAFPSTVKLSTLVEQMYQFLVKVVNFSSMLLTIYDRDTDKAYNIFAVRNGEIVTDLSEQPVVKPKRDRPTWWQVTQQEKHPLYFSPLNEPDKASTYRELLTGVWGNQRQAGSFLLLPMKMFNRVIGSLSLSSISVRAYSQEKIQVLETMLQIVTVNIENAKLYERDHHLLQEAQRRESELAEINSALQSISSVLNVTELLNNLVESVAKLVNADLCVFFQLSSSKEELVVHAIYAPTRVNMHDDGSNLPAITPRNRSEHDELIKLIRLQFKDTFLEQVANSGAFFDLDRPKLEELAQKSGEGGAIFLREAQIQLMRMFPMIYQTELIGILGVPLSKESRIIRPKEVVTIQAICAQATSAIRNAQLFEQREEAYAELQRMDKLKDEFLVTASHELRTPLSAISGYSSLLKRQNARSSPQHVLRYATKIASAAQQLTDLVSNMTEAAKMGAVDKKMDLQITPVQVLVAAEMAANMLTINIEQSLVLQVDPDLWVLGDALHFRQVMTNLLENAAKYSPPDSQIILSARAHTLAELAVLLPDTMVDHAQALEQGDLQVVLIRVQDQGEGILPEDQQRIFEKFFRAPRSLTTPVRGTGLGLFICRRYVEAMGGKLGLERTVPNEGSVFSFYLPRAELPVEMREHDEHEESKI